MEPILGVLLLLSVAGTGFLLYRNNKLGFQIRTHLDDRKTFESHANDTIQRWQSYASQLKAENEYLAKWKVVADADQKASEILANARAGLEKAKAEAGRIIAEARQNAEVLLARANAESLSTTEKGRLEALDLRKEADAALASAREQARDIRRQAEISMELAAQQANQIISAANVRAEQIAGSAFDAKNKADLYERTARAMKNIIEGYGDQYIVPSHSLLDDLAQDFGHVEAGQRLKAARDSTKSMIKNNAAGTCEYVEAYRRETAINFVVDAFNGKVDSVLSRSKHDNAGKLAEEIRDAFVLVNFNGKAFRDARITEPYLDSRLEELKWAAVAHQLRLEEREEQRRIKEQIREEEKAKREFERAIREAAKEEDMLRKAMQKAQMQIEQASAEQRVKFEIQLQELEQRLREAEAKGERAISMAQQTKRGNVYIISNVGSFGENVYKIGLTRRLEPLDRIRELGDSSVPFEFDVHALVFSEDAPALERQLHKHFVMNQLNKVNHRKEFFRANLNEIKQQIDELGLIGKWTMVAEAAEYRESLRIEKLIQENPEMKQAWLQRQLQLDPVIEESTLAVDTDISESENLRAETVVN